MGIEKGVAWNMELVGYHDLEERPGFQMAMQVVEGKWYLYMGHFWHQGWSILDVTEPSDPRFIKFIPGPAGTETVKVQVADNIMITSLQKSIAFPGRPQEPSYEEGIYVWDVKDPVNPKRLGHWKTGCDRGTHRNYYGGGRYVHCAAAAPGFSKNIYRIVDIADPGHPVEAGRWWLPEQWAAGGGKVTKPEVALHGPPYPVGDRAYLSYADEGLVILDISDIAVPRLVGHLEVYPPLGTPIACHTALPLPRRKLAIMSSEGIGPDIAEHVFGVGRPNPLNFSGIVDVSDETRPTLIAIFPIPEPPPGSPFKNFHEKGGWFGPHNWHEPHNHPDFEDRDDRVYLTYFNAGVRVYNISDPYLPKEIAYYVPPNPKKRLGMLPLGQLVVSSEDIVVDRRGYIYITDKNLGLHILRCTV
ncbi:MAG: hypothetical protein ABSH25_10450 [Syntrophorhabdales bacterium]